MVKPREYLPSHPLLKVLYRTLQMEQKTADKSRVKYIDKADQICRAVYEERNGKLHPAEEFIFQTERPCGMDSPTAACVYPADIEGRAVPQPPLCIFCNQPSNVINLQGLGDAIRDELNTSLEPEEIEVLSRLSSHDMEILLNVLKDVYANGFCNAQDGVKPPKYREPPTGKEATFFSQPPTSPEFKVRPSEQYGQEGYCPKCKKWEGVERVWVIRETAASTLLCGHNYVAPRGAPKKKLADSINPC